MQHRYIAIAFTALLFAGSASAMELPAEQYLTDHNLMDRVQAGAEQPMERASASDDRSAGPVRSLLRDWELVAPSPEGSAEVGTQAAKGEGSGGEVRTLLEDWGLVS